MSEHEDRLESLFPPPRARRCPKCGRTDAVKRIIYGLPAGPLEPGEVGGCCLLDDDSRVWYCRRCQHEFGLIADDDLPDPVQ